MYVLTATSRSGETVICREMVKVIPEKEKAPSCTLSVEPSVITRGQSVHITWSSKNAVSARLSGFGSVSPHGSLTAHPTEATTYRLTVRSASGESAICEAPVRIVDQPVIPPPPILPPPQYPYVELNQIPYTGFDFGPIGNSAYWFGLITASMGGAYTVFYSGGGIFRRMRSLRDQIDELVRGTA